MQRQGLEETIKELQKIINEATKGEERARREEEKIR